MSNQKDAGPRRMWCQRLPVATIAAIKRLQADWQRRRGEPVSQSEVVAECVKYTEQSND